MNCTVRREIAPLFLLADSKEMSAAVTIKRTTTDLALPVSQPAPVGEATPD